MTWWERLTRPFRRPFRRNRRTPRDDAEALCRDGAKLRQDWAKAKAKLEKRYAPVSKLALCECRHRHVDHYIGYNGGGCGAFVLTPRGDQRCHCTHFDELIACKNCLRPQEEHTEEGKCLFDATYFELE